VKRDGVQRVCYFGTYRTEYSRNQIMIEGLRRAGIEVVECSEPLWRGIEDRVQAASGGWRKPTFWMRFFGVYLRLLRRYRKVGDYDVLITGYPGQVDVFLARLLSWIRRRPLVWDVFMSIYLIAVERELQRRSPAGIRLLRLLERTAARLPDCLVLDTSLYVRWFHETHGTPVERFRLVPTGADDRIFQPAATQSDRQGVFRVLYYGTFIPNHGVEFIIEAARLLRDEAGMQFELIGQGPDLPKAKRLVQEYGLENVCFVEWLEKEELVRRAAQADVCLGAFGATPQSLMTVQNKIYEGLAMRKPVITGDSEAVRQELEHGEQLYLCERKSGESLAEAIRILFANPNLCQKLAEQGYQIFTRRYSLLQNGRRFAAHLDELVSEKTR
jgi:glycosyltransferase involved in cell wall biosynthesis